ERAAVLHGVRVHGEGRARTAGGERDADYADPRVAACRSVRLVSDVANRSRAIAALGVVRVCAGEDVLAEAIRYVADDAGCEAGVGHRSRARRAARR